MKTFPLNLFLLDSPWAHLVIQLLFPQVDTGGSTATTTWPMIVTDEAEKIRDTMKRTIWTKGELNILVSGDWRVASGDWGEARESTGGGIVNADKRAFSHSLNSY